MKKHQLRNIMIIIAFTVVLIFFFIHLSDIWNIVETIFTVLAPILYGLVIAYVLNYPFKVFYNHAFKKMGTKHKWLQKLRKPLALVCSYVIILGILTFLVSIMIPELSSSITTLVNNIPEYTKQVRGASDSVVDFIKLKTGYNLYDADTYQMVVTFLTGDSSTEFVKNTLSGILPNTLTTVWDIGTALYNWVLGLVISIYLLAGKETLLRQSKKLILAYIPEKIYVKLFKFADVMNNKCGKFIIGKIIDSSIIGLMCFIGLSIFQFHYALLISFIIGLFNMIPFFGPVFGAIPCTLLLLIIDPIEALWFVVFIVILQWFDGNILGPKILGESVGISGFWIMVSVIVGGGFFGVPGMILGVPVFAALFVLISENAVKRLQNKKLKKRVTAVAEAGEAPIEAEPDNKEQ